MQTARKKLGGRKLDYDCKKRHGADADEIIDAEKKFAESYQVFNDNIWKKRLLQAKMETYLHEKTTFLSRILVI